jgi:hypothetical protein
MTDQKPESLLVCARCKTNERYLTPFYEMNRTEWWCMPCYREWIEKRKEQIKLQCQSTQQIESLIACDGCHQMIPFIMMSIVEDNENLCGMCFFNKQVAEESKNEITTDDWLIPSLKIKCYVGDFKYKPDHVIPEYFHELHPRDFSEAIKGFNHDIWTNNIYAVDRFPAENIIVCGPNGNKSVTEHPDWHQLKNKISGSEFWSLVGESWF